MSRNWCVKARPHTSRDDVEPFKLLVILLTLYKVQRFVDSKMAEGGPKLVSRQGRHQPTRVILDLYKAQV